MKKNSATEKKQIRVNTHRGVLKALHRESSHNARNVKSAIGVFCFSCLAKIDASKIRSWCDEGNTARCPVCGTDSLITLESVIGIVLPAMNSRYFGTRRKVQ